MADIDVERKGPSIWPWIIGLIVLALLIWLLAEWLGDDEEEVVTEPAAVGVVDPVAPPPPVPVAQGPLTLADVLGNPAAAIGQPVSTPQAVRVTEVVSDRGFWVEDQGQRVFVVLNEGRQQNPQPGTADVQGMPAEKPDINQGDMVQITEAVAHDATSLQHLQGPIDEQTRQVLSGQQVFLITDGRNVQKV